MPSLKKQGKEETMMKRYQYLWFSACYIVLLTCIISCSSQEKKDTSIKADLSVKAESQIDFAGVLFTVEQGIVTLSGQCPTEKSRKTVVATVKQLYGVNKVVNNIIIAPVTIGTDQQLKHNVDSILKQYAGVEAITKDSIVQLRGKIETSKLQQLTDAVNGLKPKRVENNFTVETQQSSE